MFYKYDPNKLQFVKTKLAHKIALGTVIVVSLITFSAGRLLRIKALDDQEKELLVVNLAAEKNKFTQEKFAAELERLNVKFPHIVMAQSIIETGHWTSNVFKENHNLFGMKQATVRINTANGTQNGHAYYDDWYQSVYDYAFYQCRYLGGISTEEDYYAYLGQNYAQAGNYVQVLKNEGITHIVLAGFLWKVPENLVKAYNNKIVNIHPALLPAFGGKGMYGEKVHQAVISAGEKKSGITIHLVDEHYDNGKTLFQATVEVLSTDNPDTLAEKVHALEHAHYPKVIAEWLKVK
jgi:folate-dependent phosphoribosylglycinamide formyltransferase PurN